MARDKSFISNFKFLGNREYIQGGTIMDGLLEAVEQWSLGVVKQISARFNGILTTQARFDLLDPDDTRSLKKAPAHFNIETETGVYSVAVTALDDRQVEERISFNESELSDASSTDLAEKEVHFSLMPSMSILRVVIALNKHLLSHFLSSEGYGRWILARYKLDWCKTKKLDKSKLTLKLLSSIGGMSTKTAVVLDNDQIGEVYFTREKIK